MKISATFSKFLGVQEDFNVYGLRFCNKLNNSKFFKSSIDR